MWCFFHWEQSSLQSWPIFLNNLSSKMYHFTESSSAFINRDKLNYTFNNNKSPFGGPHSKVNFSFQWLNYGVYFSLVQSSLQMGSFSRCLSSVRELTSQHSEVTVVPTSSTVGQESMLRLVLGLQVQRIHKWIMTWRKQDWKYKKFLSIRNKIWTLW